MIKQINNIQFQDGLFEALKTDSPMDKMFSIDGGIPKATNWMLVGDPGVGKSTVALDLISNVKNSGGKVLFISAEMNEVDLYLYVKRYPKFGDIDIFFPQEIDESQTAKVAIETVLNDGYDLVLIDSFVELQSIVKETSRMTSNSSEKWLLQLMYNHNMAQNDSKRFTSFINIQQVNKGGQFVGSNKLKHMTTGMLEIRFADDSEDERYVMFTKNRRGDVHKKMYFNLSGTGNVSYDTERFERTEDLRLLKKAEAKRKKNREYDFDKLFGISAPEQESDQEFSQEEE